MAMSGSRKMSSQMPCRCRLIQRSLITSTISTMHRARIGNKEGMSATLGSEQR